MNAKNHDVEKERYKQRTIAEAAWSDHDSDDRPKTDRHEIGSVISFIPEC